MRVLILAYDFPPYVSVGGLRPYSWYRYLKEFGIEPVVVTRQWANDFGDERDYVAPSATDRVEVEQGEFGTLLRAPHRPNLSERLLLRHGPERYRLPRRAVTASYDVAQYYADVGPRAPLVHAARAYLREHRVDAIVATGSPYVLFRYASKLSREFGIPWVADYRDPWSQDKQRNTHPILDGWLTSLERRIVGTSALITTPAESFGRLLTGLHAGKRVEIVPNGYDPEAMAAAEGVAQDSDRLTLAFAGRVYAWHPVESVFGVLSEFVMAHPGFPFRLRMVGVTGRSGLETMLHQRFPDLAGRVVFTRGLPNAEMAVELARAHAFLLFNTYANPGTKIYDYLALRRRILLCYGDDPEARRLKEEHYNIHHEPGNDERAHETLFLSTGAGVVVRDAAHLRVVMEELRREFLAAGGISCASHGVERFSRRTHAGTLAVLLREIVP